MKLKKITTFMLCLLILIGMSACGSKSSDDKTNDQVAEVDEEVELRISWWGGTLRQELWDEVLDKFEEEYPNIKVSREFADFAAYWDRLNTQTAGGNAPDVMLQTKKANASYIKNELLMSLNDFVEAGDIDLSNFNQEMVEGDKVDDNIYMILLAAGTTATFYNADIFEEAGVAPPKANWTWDEFVDKAVELQGQLEEGQWVIPDMSGIMEGVFKTFLYQRDKSFFSEDGKLGFEKQDMIEYLSIWNDLREAGALPPPDVQEEYSRDKPEQTMFAQGKTAMFMTPAHQFNAFQIAATDQFEINRLPISGDSLQEQAQDTAAAHISINAKTEHPKEAALLVDYLLNDPFYAKTMGIEYGTLGSSEMNEIIKENAGENEGKIIDFMEEIDETLIPEELLPVEGSEIVQLYVNACQSVNFGQSSIEQAVDDFFDRANQLLE